LSFTPISHNPMGSIDGMGNRSDADGRFQATLRRLPEGESFEIHATRPGYTSHVFYESDIPYATLPLSDRKEMARQAQDGDMSVPPLNDPPGEAALRRDIYLAPSR
jgi:hypothetical protein